MKSQRMNLASQIKAARERLKLSQSQAAKAWGVPVKSLQNWEQNRSSPQGKTLERLWSVLFPK